MKGDFTRNTFDRTKHYSSVRMQQGRVQLDSDWNEQVEIQSHLNQTTQSDVIGRCGAPLVGGGFQVTFHEESKNLMLSPGHLYVEGILCELEESTSMEISGFLNDVVEEDGQPLQVTKVQVATMLVDGHQFEKGQLVEISADGIEPNVLQIGEVNSEEQILMFSPIIPNSVQNASNPRIRRIMTYSTQPDPPELQDLNALQEGTYVVYLDVWQRHITALDDGEIREVALKGPDSATRTRTVWQVKLFSVLPETNCLSEPAAWQALTTPSTGQLRARVEPVPATDDPCIVAPSAGYRGLENQLYRVEIHEGSALGQATFMWSRENGSVVAQWINKDNDDLTVSSSGRDKVLGFSVGDWVELTDDTHVLRGEPGTLVQLDRVEGQVLTIKSATATGSVDLDNFPENPKVRRWDSAGTIPISTTGGAISLEDGVEVEFKDGDYRTGDYWMIPARTVTGDVEWPRDETGNPLSQPPHGIQHHYCRLALLRKVGSGPLEVEDCRNLFPSVTELTSLFYLSGDRQEAIPNLTRQLGPSGRELLVFQPEQYVLLSEPLQVGVANGEYPVVGAQVKFEIKKGEGTLVDEGGANVGPELIVSTQSDGVASCEWKLAANVPTSNSSQQVEATLFDDAGDSLHLSIRFTAHLMRLMSLLSVGGDGQEARPDPTQPAQRILLPQPLQAGVAFGELPVVGAQVKFEILESDGTLVDEDGNEVGKKLIVSTQKGDPTSGVRDGVASCQWKLDAGMTAANSSQLVEATLLDESDDSVYLPIQFTASLSVAGLVAYNPVACPDLQQKGVTTVQAAIDELCKGTTDHEPGIHITNVLIGSDIPGNTGPTDLKNDGVVSAVQLAEGIHVVCDKELALDAVDGKPVCFVTVDMPSLDEDLSGGKLIVGYRPLILAAKVIAKVELDQNSEENYYIVWEPTTDTQFWLNRAPTFWEEVLRELGPNGLILAHLTLKGNFIWAAQNKNEFLDGPAFGMPGTRNDGSPRTDVRFRSGNGRRGGDFEMWFWLKVLGDKDAGPIPVDRGAVTINVNTASPEGLETLPGIGSATAQKIIDGRPFATVDDISKVSGISANWVTTNRNRFTV